MSESAYFRSPLLLDRSASRLLIVDMQQKLVPVVHEHAALVANCRKLLEAATLLSVPTFATEQYPKGLGSTIDELTEWLPDERPEKVRFSAAEALVWAHTPPTVDDRHQVVVAGIETHVCVLQTVFDLMSAGHEVYVVADGVSSRRMADHQHALDRMSAAGATVVTTESVLFEWCEVAGTDQFKQLSKLFK